MSAKQFGSLVIPNRKPRHAFPRTFAEASARLGKKNAIKIGRNTYLQRDLPEATMIYLKLHDTYIVTFYGCGSARLSTGGWQTATTRARLSACGFNVSCAGGIASILWRGRDYAWRDGLTLNPRTGKIRGPHDERLPLAEACRVKRRRALARDKAGDLPRLRTRQFSEWIPGGNTVHAREQ